MPTYTKTEEFDGWSIYDGDDENIAEVQTEAMADLLLAMLLGDLKKTADMPKNYPADVPLGAPDPE